MEITAMRTKMAKNPAPLVLQTKFTPVSLIRLMTPPSLNSESAQKKCAAHRNETTSAPFKHLSNSRGEVKLSESTFLRKNSPH